MAKEDILSYWNLENSITNSKSEALGMRKWLNGCEINPPLIPPFSKGDIGGFRFRLTNYEDDKRNAFPNRKTKPNLYFKPDFGFI